MALAVWGIRAVDGGVDGRRYRLCLSGRSTSYRRCLCVDQALIQLRILLRCRDCRPTDIDCASGGGGIRNGRCRTVNESSLCSDCGDSDNQGDYYQRKSPNRYASSSNLKPITGQIHVGFEL